MEQQAQEQETEEGSPEAVTLTAAEWCQREGRGFLCSTEY